MQPRPSPNSLLVLPASPTETEPQMGPCEGRPGGQREGTTASVPLNANGRSPGRRAGSVRVTRGFWTLLGVPPRKPMDADSSPSAFSNASPPPC